MHLSRRVFVIISCLLLGLAFPHSALPACNLIPVAQKLYPSARGAIVSPITTQTKQVVLRLPACPEITEQFDPVAANNDVEMTFEPPGEGSPTTIAIASGVVVEHCASGAICIGCTPTECNTLRFTMPNTDDALAPPGDGRGLTGPARVRVYKNGGATLVAEIGELYEPTLGCDRRPEGVFHQLTVLPPANNFDRLADMLQSEVLATVDGGGNLLIPLDYWGSGVSSVLAERPGAPVAIFLEGSASIDAFSSDPGTSISEVLRSQAYPSSFVRSFTLDGRPLPPLLRMTADGSLLGTADAVESVLRISRNDGQGGPDLFDLGDRLFAGAGPILITDFSVSVHDPIPLEGLRSSGATVAFARDEARENALLNSDSDIADMVAEIVDSSTAGQILTQMAVAEVSNGAFLAPAIAAGDEIVAFLQSERSENVPGPSGTDINLDGDTNDNVLRVYHRQGTELTASLAIHDVSVAPAVNGHSLVVTGTKTFFRQPGAFVEAYVDGVDGIDGLLGADDVAVSPSGENLYVAGRLDSAIAAFSRDAITGTLSFVASEGPFPSPTNVVVSPDGGHVYAATDYAIVVFSRDLASGALTLVDQHFTTLDDASLEKPMGLAISPDGAHLYVVSWAVLGNAAANNSVAVYDRDDATGLLTFVQADFEGQGGVSGLTGVRNVIVSSDGGNVYVASSGNGALIPGTVTAFARDSFTGALSFLEGHVNGQAGVYGVDGAYDLALSSDEVHLYVASLFSNAVAVFRRDAIDGTLTFLEAEVDDTEGVDGLRSARGVAVSPDGTTVYATGTFDSALATFRRNAATGELEPDAVYFDGVASVSGLSTPASVVVSPDSRHVYAVGGTNSSGELAAFRAHQRLGVFDAGAPAFLGPEPIVSKVATAAERALILVPDAFVGTTDIDEIVHLYDASGPAPVLSSLGVAGADVAISDSVAAMTVRELNQGEDRNGDGDFFDDVLAVLDLNGGLSPVNTGLPADAIAVTGSRIALRTRESDEGAGGTGCAPTVPPGGCDLNGDGDADDGVVRVYSSTDHSVAEIRRAAHDMMVGGDFVAFRTDEADQGGIDLNGDADATDSVMHVYDAASGKLMNTGLAAMVCRLPGCESSVPYKVGANTVSFLTDERDQSADLNGDGDSDDIVLSVFNIRSRQAEFADTVIDNASSPSLPDPELPIFPDTLFEGTLLLMEAYEADLGVDVNRDGLLDDIVTLVGGDSDEDGSLDAYDTCVGDANADQLDVDGDGLGDTACDPAPALCEGVPIGGCLHVTAPGTSKLSVSVDPAGKRNRMKWKWTKGDETSLADLGNPIEDLPHYSLCVYDASASPQPLASAAFLPGRSCNGKACWRAVGTKGYKLADKNGSPQGIVGAKLIAGDGGRASLLVNAKGTSLTPPALPLQAPVTVQLVVNEGARRLCWEAMFSEPSKNDDSVFSARGE